MHRHPVLKWLVRILAVVLGSLAEQWLVVRLGWERTGFIVLAGMLGCLLWLLHLRKSR